MPPATTDQLESIRDSALDVLRPFGFEDCEDENPALIWHPELRRSFDMSASDPYKIVLLVAQTMHAAGYDKAQQDMREVMGLS